MPHAPGTRIGSYEIVSLIGAGGMGEVYRARDLQLDRDVALKILPPSFVNDPDRLMRFEREAKTLAALNHPHIAQIHGLEVSRDNRALIMELVEGEDLAQRLARGALAVDEALPIACQIADALAAAHAHGIIHRDLKPANVKLQNDGGVKVLDFGLAKALAGSDANPNHLHAPFSSPTILSPAVTGYGVILGTAAYMAPEQARGRRVDQRADIWAFGCLLFEMLSGHPAFPGDDITAVLAKVIERDPDWTALASTVPDSVVAVLRRCLQKDPAKRWHHVGDARLDLEEAQLRPAPEHATVPRAAPANRRRARLAWACACALLMTIIAGITTALWLRPATPAEPVRFEMGPPPGESFGPNTVAPLPAISPDGRHIAFLAGGATSPQSLWIRSLDRIEARRLPGTEGAVAPLWSPDNRSIGFVAAGQLFRVDLGGSMPRAVCALPRGAEGASWGPDGTILFGTSLSGVFRVPASGGDPVAVTTPGADDGGHLSPIWLPGQQHFLYRTGGGDVFRGSIDGSAPPTKLFNSDSKVEFAAPDMLLFARGGTLVAQQYDASLNQLKGEPTPLADQIRLGVAGRGAFSVSQAGVLTYRTGTSSLAVYWRLYDASGQPIRQLPLTQVRSFSISPDGQTIAAHSHETRAPNGELWLVEVARGALSRVTAPAHDDYPVWSPDGKRLVVASTRTPAGLWVIAPAGGAADERLVGEPSAIPTDWSADGLWIVFNQIVPKTGSDIWAISPAGDRVSRPIVQTPFDERSGVLSPDGNWLAYTSNETGRQEIYVKPFPAMQGKTPVSTAGGSHPRWDRSGKNLYYWAPDGRVMRVALRIVDGTIAAGNTESVLSFRGVGTIYTNTSDRYPYTLGPKGVGFLAVQAAESSIENPLTVVLNWRSLLARTGSGPD